MATSQTPQGVAAPNLDESARHSLLEFEQAVWDACDSVEQVWRQSLKENVLSTLDAETYEDRLETVHQLANRPPTADAIVHTKQGKVPMTIADQAYGDFQFVEYLRDRDTTALPALAIYISAKADDTPGLVEKLVKDVVYQPASYQGVLSAKVVGPQQTQRPDTIVVYLESDDSVQQIADWLRDNGLGSLLPTTAPMTRRLLDGVGLAYETLGLPPSVPGPQFMTSRSALIQQALDETLSTGDAQAFYNRVDELFTSAGLDPAHPDLSPLVPLSPVAQNRLSRLAARQPPGSSWRGGLLALWHRLPRCCHGRPAGDAHGSPRIPGGKSPWRRPGGRGRVADHNFTVKRGSFARSGGLRAVAARQHRGPAGAGSNGPVRRLYDPDGPPGRWDDHTGQRARWSVSAMQLVTQLAGVDRSVGGPVVVAVCGGADFGAVVRDDSQRVVWATPDDVFYTRGTGEVVARRVTSSGTLAAGSWRLFLPTDDVAAAAALWRGGVRPFGEPSVFQWRWLGERGWRPVANPQLLVGWRGLAPGEVADRAALAWNVPVSVVDQDGGVHRAGGVGTPVTLLLLPDGVVVGVAPFAAELTTVLGDQAPPGLRSVPLGRPSVVADHDIRLLKPTVGLRAALKAITAAVLAWQAGSPVNGLPLPSAPAARACLGSGASRQLDIYYQTHNTTSGQYVSPLELVTEGTGATALHLGAFTFEVNTTALKALSVDGLNPRIRLNGLPVDHPGYDRMWADLQELRDKGMQVLMTLGGPGPRGSDLGDFVAYSDSFDTYWNRTFRQLYAELTNVLVGLPVDGIDMFREPGNYLPAFDISQLVDALAADFGSRYAITMSYKPLYELNPGIFAARDKVDRHIISGFTRGALEGEDLD